MARETNKLTDRAVKALKPRAKPYLASDGQCLYLLVKPNGSKLWRLRYREPDRTQQDLALGQYPEVTIAEARERTRAARLQLRDGVDPAAARKEAKQERQREAVSTFDAVAESFFARQSWKADTAAKQRQRVRDYLSPVFGSRPVATIKRAEVVEQLDAVALLGKPDTLKRVKNLAQLIFRHAVQLELCESHPAADLRGIVKTHKPKNMAAVTNPERLGQVLRMFDSYTQRAKLVQVAYALRLLPHIFVRPVNLRFARWQDIRWDAGYMEIVAENMKESENGALLVPLSTQVIGILRELQRFTGNAVYLFPGAGTKTKTKPISANTINKAMRVLGLSKQEVTGHGFRSTARTLMAERGVSREWIETQLHHKLGSAVEQAYNRAQYLPQRRVLMQEWSDYLDSLKLKAGNTAV